MKLRPFPILTGYGFAALAVLPVLGLVGVLTKSSPLDIAVLCAIVFLLFVLLAATDYLRWQTFFRELTTSIDCPIQIFTDTNHSLTLNLDYLNISLPSAGIISLRIEAPHDFSFNETPLAIRNLVPSRTHLEIPFRVTLRGDYHLSQIWLRVRSHPQTWFEWQISTSTEKPVHIRALPNPFSEAQSFNSLLRSPSNATMAVVAGRAGREFDRLRAYNNRDDLRAVDWKRSARRGSLVVREYRPETHQRISLLLDCSRRMGTGVDHRNLLDVAVDSAALLTFLSQQNEDEVGLFAFHHKILRALPPKRGASQRQLLLNSLTTLTPGNLDPDYNLLSTWQLQNQRRSLAVLLTSFSSSSSLQRLIPTLINMKSRHLPLVVSIADRSIEHLRNMPARDSTDAFIIGAAQQHHDKLLSQLSLLRRSGIDTIYGDARDVAGLLRQKYFELKNSGRL